MQIRPFLARARCVRGRPHDSWNVFASLPSRDPTKLAFLPLPFALDWPFVGWLSELQQSFVALYHFHDRRLGSNHKDWSKTHLPEERLELANGLLVKGKRACRKARRSKGAEQEGNPATQQNNTKHTSVETTHTTHWQLRKNA